MVTCQSSELGREVTVELPTDFLSLGRGSVRIPIQKAKKKVNIKIREISPALKHTFYCLLK